MPNSLRARLKKLVYQGVLSEKDLDRIEIIPVDKPSYKAQIDYIGEILIEESKWHITADEAIKEIRKYLVENQ